jgi:hypothetical protein
MPWLVSFGKSSGCHLHSILTSAEVIHFISTVVFAGFFAVRWRVGSRWHFTFSENLEIWIQQLKSKRLKMQVDDLT